MSQKSREAEVPAVEYLDSSSSESPAGPIEALHKRLLAIPPYQRINRIVARSGLSARGLLIATPYVWLLLFFLAPFLIVLKISFSEYAIAQPPYTALFEWVDDVYLQIRLNLENYQLLFEDDLYWRAYLNSVNNLSVAINWGNFAETHGVSSGAEWRVNVTRP